MVGEGMPPGGRTGAKRPSVNVHTPPADVPIHSVLSFHSSDRTPPASTSAAPGTVVTRPFLMTLRPRGMPTQMLPSSSSTVDMTLSSARPSARPQVFSRPALRQDTPPLLVPIQTAPSCAWKIDCTSSVRSPSRAPKPEKAVRRRHARPASNDAIHKLPSWSSRKSVT